MYTTASGVQIPQGTDAFNPAAQFKTWADASATYQNRVVVAVDSARTALATPVLRDGLRCYVTGTKIEWLYQGTTWVPVIGPMLNTQLDTANTLVSSLMQTGTGKITGNGTVQAVETVTFPVAFSATPRVTISASGYRATGAFNDNGLSGSTNWASAAAKVPGSFLAIQTIGGATLSSSFDYYYDWIAIGPA